jgi:hypothetical protein
MKYAIEKSILWKVVDDEVVIVDPRTDEYSYLNSTGKEVWQMIAQGYPFEKMVESLCANYDERTEKIEHDCRSLIRELLKADLIVEITDRNG